MAEMHITHNTGMQRFETEVEGYTAVLDYRPYDGGVVFTHTGVPRPIEGKGVGRALVKAGLDHAREQGWTVVPACSFVATYMRRHPEYADLVRS